jgi:hypothetical protein
LIYRVGDSTNHHGRVSCIGQSVCQTARQPGCCWRRYWLRALPPRVVQLQQTPPGTPRPRRTARPDGKTVLHLSPAATRPVLRGNPGSRTEYYGTDPRQPPIRPLSQLGSQAAGANQLPGPAVQQPAVTCPRNSASVPVLYMALQRSTAGGCDMIPQDCLSGEGRNPEIRCLPRCQRGAFAGMTDRA